jgi:PKD repeat protein
MERAFPSVASAALVVLSAVLVTGAEAAPTGGPDSSSQAYRWVDSTAAGCASPMTLPSTNPIANLGCPGKWTELVDSSSPFYQSGALNLYGVCCVYYAEDYYWWTSLPFPFQFYGGSHGSGSTYPANMVSINSNGFIEFSPGPAINCGYPPSGGDGIYSGNPSSSPAQMPRPWTAPSGACTTLPTVPPTNMVAGFWTNMRQGNYYPGYGPNRCPDDDPSQGVYYKSVGTSPRRMFVVQYHKMRVSNPSQAYSAATVNGQSSTTAAYCQQAHTFATFQIVLHESTNAIDVLIKDAKATGQDASMGIQDTTGTVGLSYGFFPGGTTLADLGVRYYPKNPALAFDATANLVEDTVGTFSVDAFDPDYHDRAAAMPNGIQSVTLDTSMMTNPSALATVAGNPVAFTYTPPADWNGVDQFKFKAKSVDGTESAWKTMTIKVAAVNDAPDATSQLYDVLTGDDLYVPAPGVLLTATDAEIQRGETPVQKLRAVLVTPVPAGQGSLSLLADGTVDYQPDPSMVDGDQTSFTFRACDDGSPSKCSADRTVTIRLGTPNPNLIARADKAYALLEDGMLSVPRAQGVLANDQVSPDALDVEVRLVAAPAKASPGSFGLAPDGSFSYRPLPDWNGVDMFRYKLVSSNDGESNIAIATIEVKKVNDSPGFANPVITYGPDFSMTEDGPAASLANFITDLSPGPATATDEANELASCYSVPSTQPAPCFEIQVSPPDFFQDPPYHSGPTVGRQPGIYMKPAATKAADLKFRPGKDKFGTAELTIWLRDSGGTANGGTDRFPDASLPVKFKVVVDPAVDNPVATPDAYTLLRGRTLERSGADGLLANDVDPDGEQLKAVYVTLPGQCGTFTGRDDGGFTYKADIKYAGTADCVDTFRYHAWHFAELATPATRPGKQKSTIVTSSFTVKYNGQPVSAFTVSAPETLAREAVSFSDASYDTDPAPGHPTQGIVAWLWDFADGRTSTERNPIHSYAKEGHYRVRLTVTDAMGDTATSSHVVKVLFGHNPQPDHGLAGGRAAPLAHAGSNLVVAEGAQVELQGRGTPSGTQLFYQWSQVAGPQVLADDLDRQNLTFKAPEVNGPEPVTLTFQLLVSDGARLSEPSLVQVTVTSTNQAPLADAGPMQRAAAGSEVVLDGSRSLDPEGLPLTFRWRQASGPPVQLAAADTAKARFTAPDLDAPTPLAFELAATDGELESVATVQVLVVPASEVPGGFTYRAEATPAGARITFQPVAKGTGYVWDFGDGSEGSSDATPTHLYSKPGTYQVRLTVSGEGEPVLYQKPVSVVAPGRSAPAAVQAASEGGMPAWAAAALALGVAALLACLVIALVLGRRRRGGGAGPPM